MERYGYVFCGLIECQNVTILYETIEYIAKWNEYNYYKRHQDRQ